jgi:hypothetical protein
MNSLGGLMNKQASKVNISTMSISFNDLVKNVNLSNRSPSFNQSRKKSNIYFYV